MEIPGKGGCLLNGWGDRLPDLDGNLHFVVRDGTISLGGHPVAAGAGGHRDRLHIWTGDLWTFHKREGTWVDADIQVASGRVHPWGCSRLLVRPNADCFFHAGHGNTERRNPRMGSSPITCLQGTEDMLGEAGDLRDLNFPWVVLNRIKGWYSEITLRKERGESA